MSLRWALRRRPLDVLRAMNTRSAPRFLSAAIGLLAVSLPCAAYADCEFGICTFNVTSTFDRVDRVPGDGVCDSPPNAIGGSPGPCTLRAAIMEANEREAESAANGPYTINLPAGDYSLTRPNVDVPDADDANGSANVFADDVTIAGPGGGVYAVIRGSESYAGRLLHGSGAHNLTIRDVELTASEHGISCFHAGNNLDPDAGSMKLTRVRLHHLISAGAQSGGAIESPSDCQLEVSDAELWANDSFGRGSAIYIGKGGLLTAERVALIANGSAGVPAIAEGTALFATSASVILRNVTIAGNHAGGFGSIAVSGDISQGGSLLELSNVTIARNVSSENDGTAGLFMGYGQFGFKNSVVADNLGGSGDLRFDLDALAASGGYNVLGAISPESGSHDLTLNANDRVDRSNVGLSQVPTSLPASIGVTGLRPVANGMLVDQGNPAPFSDSASGACPVLDTSGRKRRAGGRCDIGATEYFPEPWTFHAVQLADAVDGDPGDGVRSTIVLPGAPNATTCTLRAAVMESASLHADGHVGLFKANLVPGNHDLSIGDADDSDPASGDLDVQGFDLAVQGDEPLWQMASTVRAAPGFPDRLFDVTYDATESDTRLKLHNAALASLNIQPIDGRGAGVNCTGAHLEITGSRLHDLGAVGGSAISAVVCAVLIADSDIAGNESAPFCGAVYNLSSYLEITRSTLSGNRAGGNGSAICDDEVNGGGQTRLTAVTISSNHGTADNTVVSLNGNSSLRNVTITGNTAEAGATNQGALRITDPDLTLHNSIVSGNGGGSDLYIEPGASITESNNLIGTLTPGSSPLPNSAPGQPAGVGTLTQLSNTGLSWGHIPVPGGSAHNTGHAGPGFSDDPHSPLCARYDHSYRDRGLDPDHLCDIGAVEFFAVPPPPLPLDTIFKNDFEVF